MHGRAVVLATALVAACEVSVEKIEAWKDTQRGPFKIRTALNDDGQAIEVRTAALIALVDIDHPEWIDEDFKTLPAAEVGAIVDRAMPGLIQKMNGTNPKAPPKPGQIKAKDAVFALRSFASPAVRAQVDTSLIEWIAVDLGERLLLGLHNAVKIATAVGPAAGPALARSLGPETLDVVEPATLLRQVGDAASIEAGAENLVRLAQAQRPAREQTYLALGRLGGKRAAQYLNEVARSGEAQLRQWALRALQLVGDPSSVAGARAIAGNVAEDLAIRQDAFDLLGVIAKAGDASAGEALLGFLGDKNEKVRYTVIDALCQTQKDDLIAKMLQRLPPGAPYKPGDLRDLIEEPVRRSGVGEKLAPALRAMLGSPSWITRLVAARLLGDFGTVEDVVRLQRLGSADDTPLRGWPGGATVGSEARAAAQRIQRRG